jgi:hypothetical protein
MFSITIFYYHIWNESDLLQPKLMFLNLTDILFQPLLLKLFVVTLLIKE